MCGFVGIVNLENRERISEDILVTMVNTMVHRGPDDWGLYIDNRIAFGHRRLSIIDLSSAGKQPMFDYRKRALIIYNGEVYNYQELKNELKRDNVNFFSNTDTEVLINLYLKKGIKFINDLNGQFAFSIYDILRGKVFVFRDRIGIKPLYYSFFDGKLIFASEIKAILKYPGFRTSPDYMAISSYLSFRYPIEEHSLFLDIKTLQPGNFIEIDLNNNEFKIKKYWELPILLEKEEDSNKHKQNIRKLLKNSVKYRMLSDVPLGAYLSGGVDSSIITSIMAKNSHNPVKTFTIGFIEDGYNEFKYAKLVSQKYKTEHHEIVFTKESYIENMQTLIKFKDLPLGVINEPSLYAMSKALKEHITVVLSGEGADEVFGGYGRIFRSPLDFFRLSELVKYGENRKDIVIREMMKNLSLKYGNRNFKNKVEHFLFLYQYFNWDDKKRFLSNDYVKLLDRDIEIKNIFSKIFGKIKKLPLYDQYMWVFLRFHIRGLLQRLDTATMATSVEGRVPFLDHKLIEYSLTIPYSLKIRWKSYLHELRSAIYNSDQISETLDTPKYILKESFKKELPRKIINRKKVGFPVPFHLWLMGDLTQFAKSVFTSRRAKERGIYNIKEIIRVLENREFFKNYNNGIKIWMLLNLELWLRNYFD